MPSIIFSDLLESALDFNISFMDKVFREGCLGRKNVQKIHVLREGHEMRQLRSEFSDQLTQKNVLLNSCKRRFQRSFEVHRRRLERSSKRVMQLIFFSK